MSFGFGFGFPRGGSAGAWSPSSLFVGGVQGAIYDPSYLNTYMSGLGPELVTNGGPFTNTTGWGSLNSTLSVSSGALRVTENGVSSNPFAQQSFSVTSGAWYKITFDLVALNAQKIRVWVGSAYGSANWLNSADITYTGPVTLYFLAAGSTAYFEFVGYCTAGGTSEYYEVNYVSVKQVTTIGNATMFTTSAGTTPVTAVEQNVGLILDQSQGLVLGSELVTNGDFSGGTTGWSADRGGSLSVVGGALRVTQGAVTDYAVGYQTVTLVVGQWYRLTVDFVGGTAANVQVGVGTSFTAADATFLTTATSPRTLTVYFAATATTMYVRGSVNVTTDNVYADFDNFSLKAIPGNHAYVTADANRGILRSRFNQLTYSEQFDNAVWTKSFVTVTANQTTAPDGTTTADKILATAGYDRHATYISGTALSGTCTLSVYAKYDTHAFFQLAGSSGGFYANFNISTGVVGAGGGVRYISHAITNVGSGWYRLSVVYTNSGDALWLQLVSSASDAALPFWTAAGTESTFVWGAQVVPTDVFPTNTYQRIAAATDYATGPAFPLYIQTDGTNDAMLTNTINFANGPSSPPLGPELVTGAASAYSGNGTVATVGDTITATCTTNGIYGITWTSSAVSNLWALCTFEVVTNSASKFMFVFLNGNVVPFAAGNTTGSRSFIAFAPTATGSTARPIFYINGLVGESFSVRLVSIKEMDSAYAPDKMTVTAGVTKLSNTAIGVVTELSADASGNAGSFYISAPDTAAPNYGWRCGGSIRPPSTTALTYSAPITNVVLGLFDISGDSLIGQINGAQVANNTADQGTGTFGNYPLYLFARGNASLYFTGYFYGAVVVQKYLSAGELASLTNWMEVRTFGKDMSYSYDYLTLDNGDSVTLDNGDPVYTNIYYS